MRSQATVSSHTDSRNITWVVGVLSTQYSRCSENVFVLMLYLWSSCSTVFFIKQRNEANNKTKVVVVVVVVLGVGGGGEGSGSLRVRVQVRYILWDFIV